MNDFIGERECVTHHICDCKQRELYLFRSALREIAASRKPGEQPSPEQLIARSALTRLQEPQ